MAVAPQTSRTNNGHQAQSAPRRPQVHRVEVPEPEHLHAVPEEPMGAVVRDAIDQTREIVRDTVAIGALEVKRVGLKAKRTVDDVAPRVLWATVATIMGSVATVLLLIAAFIGAEAIIPSTAARLAIIALPFVGVAAYGGWRAGKAKTLP